MEKIFEKPMEYTIWKTKKGFVLSVFVNRGVIDDFTHVLLRPEEFTSIFIDIENIENMARAIANMDLPRSVLEDFDTD